MPTEGKGGRFHAGRRWIIAAVAASLALVGSGSTPAHADVLTATSAPAACPAPLATMPGGPATTVILTGGSADGLGNLVGCATGQVLGAFPFIDAVVATVPSPAVAALSAVPGVTVTPDLTGSVQSTPVSTGPHTPSDAFLQETGASNLAAAGDTGQGVTVAVLDTGVDDLPDFNGRLLAGVDLTGGQDPFRDAFGHGTFVAGLIAGDGASSGGRYAGEAPGANLVAIKVAGPTGQTDMATVIAGIGWAIGHRQQYDIRVLNISLGFQPVTSTVSDPLDLAVEAAWNSGIAVVTSAGNAGPFNGTILSPGDDPLAITVGALDDMATPSPTDDEMNDFSSAGPTSPDGWIKPDLAASGRSVVSLAAPGSTVWTQYPSARIGSGNFVGSGTSFSAAITSGAAALVLAAHPADSPDQLKARLIGTAAPGPVGNPFVDGHGALDALAATTSQPLDYGQSIAGVSPASIGTTVSLAPTGPADTWNAALWSGAAWNGGPWNGAAWNGAAWNGAAWNGAAWNGAAWNGAAWNGAAWNGAAWNGAAWNGAAWNGSSWSGAAWNGAAWNDGAWS